MSAQNSVLAFPLPSISRSVLSSTDDPAPATSRAPVGTRSPPPSANTVAVPSIPIFPYAAIVVVILAVFVVIVAAVLIVRKSLRMKGLCMMSWQPDCQYCTSSDPAPSCREQVLKLARAMDCDVPSCQMCLDNICPSQQSCSAAWSRLWSCSGCVSVKEACVGYWGACPGCAGPSMECPDCDCCGECCHCALKMPQCTHISCLCCECGKPDRTNTPTL